MENRYAHRIAQTFLRNILMTLLTLFALSEVCSAADIGFSEAMGLMKARNDSLQAARMEENQRVHEQEAARGLYLPEIDMSGRYTRIDEPITIDLDGIRQAMGAVETALHGPVGAAIVSQVPPFRVEVQNDAYWKADVSLLWPIYTGGRISAANRAADAALEASREKYRETESHLTSRLGSLYFGLGLARQVEQVRREVLSGMDAHLHQAQQLEQNGMIARSERLHAEVARAEADRQLKRAIHDTQIAQTALNNLLASREDIHPLTPMVMVSQLEPLSFFQETAQRKNPVLGQLGAQKEMAHQSSEKETGTLYPEISLFGKRELYTDDLTVLDPQWALGIGVKFKIFDGMSRYHRVQAAKDQEYRVLHLDKEARRDIDTLVESRYQELLKTREQYDTIKSSLVSAEEYLRVEAKAFEEGMATSVDLVDAQLALSRVRIERLQALYEYDVALAELLETSGMSDRYLEYLSLGEKVGEQ